MIKMLITVLTKKLDTCIKLNQSLHNVSGIQLVDYDFPSDRITFKTAQTVKRQGTNLITFPPGSYSFADIVTNLNHGVSGVSLHGLLNQIHIRNSGGGMLSFSDEIKEILHVTTNKPLGQSYALSWSLNSYHLFANLGENNSAFGFIVRDDKVTTTNLLAAIPSMSNTWPLMDIRNSYPIDSICLSLRRDNGEIPSFDGKQIRISFKISFNVK